MSTGFRHELVGVFGSPIDENPSGLMLEAAFAARDLAWRYQLLAVTSESLAPALVGAQAMGFRGLNLTVPHKIAVIPLLDELTPEARHIGAVNTLRFEGGRIIGDNTDGRGFVRCLRDDESLDPSGMRVVVLGAGGAARAVAVELALAGVEQVTIINRTLSAAESVADAVRATGHAEATALGWVGEATIPGGTDLVVHATTQGLFPSTAMPAVAMESVNADTIVADVIPNPAETRFLSESAARGATTINGHGMLVYQGAIAFEAWTGLDAPIEAMRAALTREFG